MAIRVLNYTVTTDTITNASAQFIGTQGDKNVTKLVFNLDDKLISSLKSYSNNGKFYYRFDGYDGVGGMSSTEPIEFEPSTVNSFSYSIENWQTKYGGTIQTFFVITYIEDEATDLELYAYSVKMKLKSKPDASFVGGENYESITALAVSTKKYAEEVAVNKTYVAEAEKRVAENLVGYIPLNASLEIIFDGGDSAGGIDSIVVPDSEMSDTSENTVKNRVAKAYVDKKVDEVVEKVDEASAKAISDSHPIGSVYYSIDEQDPGELFGGTWEKVRSFYGGELIAYGRIQNTVSNTTAVTAGNVIVISDKCVPEKQYNTVNLIDGIITVDSGTFKIYTQGIAGLVEAQMIVSGRSETDCAGIWWSGNANEIPNGVEMWPNTETNQPLCHIPSNSYGSGMNTYLYHIKDTAADDTNFFVNPCCKAYAGSFTPCAGGTASALIVKVFAKSGITHSWKRTA